MDRDEANRLLRRLGEAERKLEAALAEVRAEQDDLLSMVDYDGDVTGARL